MAPFLAPGESQGLCRHGARPGCWEGARVRVIRVCCNPSGCGEPERLWGTTKGAGPKARPLTQ
ncbi:hypothetical protein FM114_13045 [Luteococcus japonicus LSP_Lj1]|uniref:Uncharacterized protein n=1 Tax=Luteococcus japonicus LSP_Lj1 TaxID=1255658 RepID=A0A1R4KCN4_9ACTN|nr:hypothetical protein FM114_13045 [Luteococcus japonicus LSP_Lj1]